MNMKRFCLRGVIALGLCGVAVQAAAECRASAYSGAEVLYEVCKDWPAYPGTRITGQARLEHPQQALPPEEPGSYELQLALVSSRDGSVQASYSLPAAILSDTSTFRGLGIDTARYRLNEQVRAFGIRSFFEGTSRANPDGQTWLTLYVRDGKTLRPILEKLVVESSSGEWDTRCNGHFSDSKSTVAVAKTRSQGYADLIVTTVATDSEALEQGADCTTASSHTRTATTTLRYDGQRYSVPPGLKAWR